jgi:SWI/SNF-related matrix-associated actin-dependent regulator 1 of chromatin subfamily A
MQHTERIEIMDIKSLVNWSEPKEVQTKHGPRMMSKAEATPEFWSAWKANKDELKAAGVSCSRDDRTGEWQAVWWQEISAEVKQARAEAVEMSRATSADVELPHPAGLDYMPFQKAGIRFALGRSGVLIGDEMGLGKTIQAIGIINSDPEIKTAIIVCPKSLKLNWKRELEKWLTRPLSIGVANGGYPDTDIVIMNYEAVGKYSEQIAAREWSVAIVDEAHYIKNAKALRSKNVKAIKADRKVRLTGTPIVNRPAELYNIIEDLGGAWGSFFSFAKRYCNAHHSGFGWDFSGAANLDELQRRLRETIMVRRLKADVLTELPRKIRQIVEVEADTAEMKRAVKSEQAHEADSEDRLADLRANVELSKAESDEAYKTAVNRLMEASKVDFTEMSRLRHETAVSKIPAVIAHIENALEDSDSKIIIAAHHHDVIDALAMGLINYGVVILTGETKEQDRQTAVDAFQNDPNVRIFIGSITAAGVGITLTASAHVVFSELDWVPGNVSQMEDRAHRIGQTETVLVQHIVLSGSLDARMAHMLVSKQNVIDSALDKNHPERTAPVYEPKAKAATADAKPDLIAKLAESMTAEKINLIHSGLRLLAGMDTDFARELNDAGFSKIDVKVGHSLANTATLTPKQAALGSKILRKYHRQLPEEINEVTNA